jgi:hypothetical protein
MGQQKVNNAVPEHPKLSELIWLNGTLRPAFPSHHKRLASTFNPKVAGSIPARPITNSLQIGSSRATSSLERVNLGTK